ncbi:MAG: site-2 protease family protein [Oscillospiraceae bacterium]|nr:site-2 protease family protein [Oscillospiraceae bacterium]
MNAFGDVFRNLDWSVVTTALLSVIPILICLTIHELAHGAAALALGDDTAKRMGRLTLNPIRHIDPIGFLMLLIARFGWAKPVPVDMRKFRNPKFGMAVTALAGPVSNFLLAILILLFQVPIMRLVNGDGVGHYVGEILRMTAIISVFLGVFNLLPIPPLDGSKIVFSILPDKQHNWLMRYERYGFFLLLVIVMFGFSPDGPLRTFMNTVLDGFVNLTHGPSMFLFG